MDIVRERSSLSRRLEGRPAKIAAALIGSALLATVFVSFAKAPAAAAPAIEKTSAWTEKVKRGDLVREVPVQGKLVPEHVQWLSAQSAGRVAKLPLRRGAEVQPDTIVVVLENTDLELAALDAERQAATAEARLIDLEVKGASEVHQHAATLAALRVDLRDADRHAQNANRLAPEGLVSDNERRDALERASGLGDRYKVEEARRAAQSAGVSRQVAAQREEIARLKEIAAFRRRQLAALQVHAGVRGTISDLPLENGQWVAIGSLLAKVAQPEHLKAEVKVAEAYVREVQPGLGVRFEGAALSCRGKVERIDPAVTAGSVLVEVRLDESLPAGARVDQAVSGYIEIEKLERVLFVARPAGVRDGSKAGVFKLERDPTYASRVNVQLGRGSARDVEVVSGLAEGDEIVVSDLSAWDSAPRIRIK